MTLVWIGVVILWLVGLAGIIVPVLPGVGLIFGGILLFALFDGFSNISPLATTIFGLVALLAYGLSYLGAVYGAKQGGGGRKTTIGAVTGAVLGLLINGPFGLLYGSFFGAFIGARLEGKDNKDSLRISLLAVVGIISSTIVQFILALAMIVAFLIIVLT